MAKLIIGNSRTEEMVGDLALLSEQEQRLGGWGAQRMLWFATDGDVLVLPWLADDFYNAYVSTMTGTDLSSLTLLVPDTGYLGTELLTPDRIAGQPFQKRLRSIVQGRSIERVVSAFDDFFVAELAESVGLADALPGHRFSAQGGTALVNSKPVFRAVASGIGVRVARGVVTNRAEQAESVIGDILASGSSVIVKQEFAGGGFGNEILAPAEGVVAAGARSVVVLSDAKAVHAYVAERWEWLTGQRRNRFVIEEYVANAVPIYAEFLVGDSRSELLGTGELLMEPIAIGEIVPPISVPADVLDELIHEGERLCDAFRGIGYRGNIATDAIWSPEHPLAFSETNGRITGSTHLHTVIRDRMLQEEHRWHRVLLERAGWEISSFQEAVEYLQDEGLTFDAKTGTGVVLTGNYVPVNGKVMYCVVEQDYEAARAVGSDLTRQGQTVAQP